MTLELNSSNINIILVNISCCIDKLSKQLLLYAATGNKKCFELTNDKIVTLDSIYNILKNYYQISYPIYQVDIFGLNPNTGYKLVLKESGVQIASGIGTTGLLSSQNLVISVNSTTLYKSYFTYDPILLKSSFIVEDYECPIDNLSLFIDTPINQTYPLVLIDNGNCQARNCFTTNELKELYQQALNMCQLCNCTK